MTLEFKAMLNNRILCDDGNVQKSAVLGFPGDAVVKNPPANAGDMDSSPGPGRSHMPWSN